jgi:RNA polymerase sigma-70 factor (ECF subfamily)
VTPSPASSPEGAPWGSDESGLLASLRAGDDSAFETLVRGHGTRLLAVARRFLRSEEDARDAVQDAFLSAFRSLDSFEGTSRLATWLHRIVVNVCLMRLRTRRRKPEAAIEDLLPHFVEDGHRANPGPAWEEPADVLIERREVRALVRAAIDRLPDGYRVVLVLRDIEELDTAETARLLELSENAVKIRLHRARQALRELLDPELSGPVRRSA